MELMTKRFLLRDFIDADLPAFEAYHADPRSLELYGTDEANPGANRRQIGFATLEKQKQPTGAAATRRKNSDVAVIAFLYACIGQQRAGERLIIRVGANDQDPSASLDIVVEALGPSEWVLRSADLKRQEE